MISQADGGSPITIRSSALPIAAAAAAIIAALVAGFAVGPGANTTVGQILSASGNSSTLVSGIGDWLPLGFAFAAGMVATVNPCGFVMLPAYLTMYVSDAEVSANVGFSQRLAKSLYVSAALGLGFVLLFGVVGLAISAGATSLAKVFPWIGFSLGFVMAGLGAYLFAGGKIYTGAASQLASRIGDPRDSSLKGYFLFGISYAVASLSCTLPIFLALVSSSLSQDGFLHAAGQFLAYALGMTFVITILTIAIGVFKGALTNQLRRVMPYVNPISAGILIVVGGYMVFYWLTEGELASSFGL